jgi:hypothetical protein
MGHSGQEELETKVVRHFKNFHVESGQNTIVESGCAMRFYPSIFSERDVQELEKPCTKEEIKHVLKTFSKDKSLDRTVGRWNFSLVTLK